jgi:hypothetical protein
MIKECKILTYNKFLNIIVFDYNGKHIQMTSHLDDEYKTVFVKYQNNRYELVSKNEYDKYIYKETNKDTSVKPRKKEKDTDLKIIPD